MRGRIPARRIAGNCTREVAPILGSSAKSPAMDPAFQYPPRTKLLGHQQKSPTCVLFVLIFSPFFVFFLYTSDRGSRTTGSAPVCLHSIPARTRGMSHTVRRSCAGHEHGLVSVFYGRSCCFSCRCRGFRLALVLTVAAFTGIQMAATMRAYSVRFAHGITSYPDAAAASFRVSCCISSRRYFLRVRRFFACLYKCHHFGRSFAL